MNTNIEFIGRRRLVFVFASLLLLLCPLPVPARAQETKPHAKVVKLDAGEKNYLPLLNGPPESVTMKSGLVVLAPGKSVGKHTTGRHEEILIVLAGAGTMKFSDRSSLPVEANHALYCPPNTEHDVVNTGTTVLRYVYVVASAPSAGN